MPENSGSDVTWTTSAFWNPAVQVQTLDEDHSRYLTSLLEQYKAYVDTAANVSQRRHLANAFFLTLNTAVITLAGGHWKDAQGAEEWILLFPLLALIGQCLVWWKVIDDYRVIALEKWTVVEHLEERLLV